MLIAYFLMGALALLVAVMLLGFAGCTPFSASDPAPDPTPPPAPATPPPGSGNPPGSGTPLPDLGDYGNWVVRTADAVAYWRLGDPATVKVLKASDPIPAGAVKTAKDSFNGYDGYHFKLAPATTPDYPHHSPKTTGEIIPGVTPGLLQDPPQDNLPCLQVTGGYVQIPWDNHLNPSAFTLEAWVSPDPTMFDATPGAQQFFYCLAESAGPAGLGQKKTGWGLYLGPQSTVAPLGPLVWQVWMGDGNKFNQVAIADTGKTQLTLTYLALTYDGAQGLELWLYYPETEQDINDLLKSSIKKPISPFTFHLNDPTSDGKGDFIIGAGSNLFPVVGTPAQRLYPFKGKIQEVALYKSVVPGSILESHFLAGGNV